jgi:hypothetical protein
MASVNGGAAFGIVGSGHASGGVDIYGGVSGGVLGDRAGMVSLDGGASGGVIGDRAGMASVDTSLTPTRSAGEEIPQ